MKYTVVCANPGMNRGGRSNPLHASYTLGDHTPAQFRDLIADPYCAVIVGEVMTADHPAAIDPPKDEAPEPDKPKPALKKA